MAVLTNAGGPGIMATDELERQGLSLAPIDPATVERLRTKLPDASNFYNPVDCLGDADAARYNFTAEAVLADPNVDAVIALLTPQTDHPAAGDGGGAVAGAVLLRQAGALVLHGRRRAEGGDRASGGVPDSELPLSRSARWTRWPR